MPGTIEIAEMLTSGPARITELEEELDELDELDLRIQRTNRNLFIVGCLLCVSTLLLAMGLAVCSRRSDRIQENAEAAACRCQPAADVRDVRFAAFETEGVPQ